MKEDEIAHTPLASSEEEALASSHVEFESDESKEETEPVKRTISDVHMDPSPDNPLTTFRRKEIEPEHTRLSPWREQVYTDIIRSR